MKFDIFFDTCKKAFEANNLALPTQEQAEKLHLLTETMLEASKHMNLTAIKEENDIIIRHYVDSILISSMIPNNAKVIDVGCGAGFPTLPLAIFRPDISILALDSTAKRINYVASTAVRLGLRNVATIATRAEDAANSTDFREKFDIATARAVASLPVLSELCLPFVKVGGAFIAMKGAKADEELKVAKNAIHVCGGKTASTNQITLKSLDATSESRYLIQINKLSATPQNYPRHFSKISKKPL